MIENSVTHIQDLHEAAMKLANKNADILDNTAIFVRALQWAVTEED